MNPKNLCPKCKVGMGLFYSLRMKWCIDCGTKYSWELTEGQQPLIKHQR